MLDVNVEFDKKELKKLIEGMDLYPNTKRVVAEYKAIADKVDERETLLKQRLTEIQGKHLQNMLAQDTTDVSDIVYLKIEAKKMAEEMQIIDTLIAETKQEKGDLMIHYFPIYRKVLASDRAIASGYNVTPIIDKVLSQTMAIIAEVGAEAREQYYEMSPDIDELFEDAKIRETFPHIRDESFKLERHSPSYSGSKTVLESHDIESATSGFVPQRYKGTDKAKDVE